ncbi:MAG: VOC family protein [Chloroflexota bacterium]|nr:VOC family protein [Chloroflexota bacterium]MDQ5866988.1 VOC family protein [Chloroflexota bacterium]
MALNYVSVVSVNVTDQDRAIDFFVNKLGFEKTMDVPYGEGERWIEVKAPDGQTTINLYKASEPGVQPGQFSSVSFYSDDVRGTVEDMRSKGVEITEDPNEQPWGVQAQFKDPDGNGYVIVGR